jgi:O-antigen ligase
MVLRRTVLQNLFLFVVTLCVSINASNSNLLIQFSSINFIIFLLLCLKNKEVLEAIKKNYINNKNFFIIFTIYISYLIFQIIPLPLNWLEVIAPTNHALYSSIKIDKEFWSLSLDPSSSYFRILNCINFFIIFLIFPALFFRSKHLMKVLFFFCLLGFCHAVFATYWMLIGNPSNFLIQKLHYPQSTTGLFVNRSVFATFLLLCAFSGLYYMVVFFQKNKITSFSFFEQVNTKIIYVRIFIIFLTIGILTTWSRIVNFSYVLVLISFLIYSKISFKKYINPLSTIILFILVFDLLILGLVFGNAKLVERYAETSIMGEVSRIGLHQFGLTQFKEFWLFGYGVGAFELVFKLFYNILPGEGHAIHAHNDGIELMGEVGIIGISILFLLSLIYFKKLLNKINQERERARFILLSLLLMILLIQSFVDFSLHIPGITILLIVILASGIIKYKINEKKIEKKIDPYA